MPIPVTKKERVWNDPDINAGKRLVFSTTEFKIGAIAFPILLVIKIVLSHGYLFLDGWNIVLLCASPVIGGCLVSLVSVLWKEVWR